MFYILSPTAGTILGLGLAVVFFWMLLKNILKKMAEGRTDTRKEGLKLSLERSDSGKCHVEDTCHYPGMRKFHAKVVCEELGYEWDIWADSQKELEDDIQKEFMRCDEKLRDLINKRAMTKQRYFRIG